MSTISETAPRSADILTSQMAEDPAFASLVCKFALYNRKEPKDVYQIAELIVRIDSWYFGRGYTLAQAIASLIPEEKNLLKKNYISVREWSINRKLDEPLSLEFRSQPAFRSMLVTELTMQYARDVNNNTLLQKLQCSVVKDLIDLDLLAEYRKGSPRQVIEAMICSWSKDALAIFFLHARQAFNIPETQSMTISYLVDLLFLYKETFFETLEAHMSTLLG